MKRFGVFIATSFCLLVGLNGFLLPQQRLSKLSFSNETPAVTKDVEWVLSHSKLFSTPDDGLAPQNPGRKFFLVIRKMFIRMVSFPGKASKKFSKLSRNAKAIVVMQALIFTMIFGSLGRKAYVSHYRNGSDSTGPAVEVPYSSFLNLVSQSGTKGMNSVVVDNVRISPDRIIYRLTKEDSREGNEVKKVVAYTRKVSASPELIDHLQSNSIPFAAAPQPRATSAIAIVARTAILGFYMLILWRMYKTFGNNAGSGDVPGKLASPASSLPLASFNDIQGIDKAKTEVIELVDALRFPEKYAILGARAPSGLLLEGPPGTGMLYVWLHNTLSTSNLSAHRFLSLSKGKTMLARATAASAGVPLLYCSGSDFVEMFVGRGAARVRKLFERASRLAPCIIFVDELDALGKARDMGGAFAGGRGNDEAEQTLNQLLACMDGLDSSRRVCVLAATNRKEVLDPALIRPGRFDRIVTLSLPDARGRENILRVHAKKLPGFKEGDGVDEQRLNSLGVGDKVDLSALAAVTSGFSGAELEFLVNEAAIRAVRRVSTALRQGDVGVTPHARAEDFELSLQNFYNTRKPKSNNVNDMWKNVWRQ
jgi:ATP-dependent Zn protease